ncbi:MAG: response regulator [bacterium]
MNAVNDRAMGMRVLLVDDDEDYIVLFRDLVTRGMGGMIPAADTASSFSDALSLIDEASYDVLLFDYSLGAETGIDLLRAVRIRGVETPVILLTGAGDEEVAVAAMKAGASDYLVKSRITTELLANSIRYAINIHEKELQRRRAEEELRKAKDDLERRVQERTMELIRSNQELEAEIARRIKIGDELISYQERLHNLYAHLQTLREEERAKVAMEIHDELGQSLTALKMDAAWISEKYKDHERIFEKGRSMVEVIDETIRTVKRICTELRPSILDHFGLTAAIEWHAGEFEKKTGIKCEVTVEPENIAVDRDQTTALFRIFQEALTNVLRHAKATRVSTGLRQRSGRIVLEIRDNGIGITEDEMSKPNSFGLLGMRERLHPLCGTLTIIGERNTGTMLTVSIPVDDRRSPAF